MSNYKPVIRTAYETYTPLSADFIKYIKDNAGLGLSDIEIKQIALKVEDCLKKYPNADQDMLFIKIWNSLD